MGFIYGTNKKSKAMCRKPISQHPGSATSLDWAAGSGLRGERKSEAGDRRNELAEANPSKQTLKPTKSMF
jgi:hypothetical protein